MDRITEYITENEKEEKPVRWIDMHCDTLSEIVKNQYNHTDGSLKKNHLSVDIERLRQAGAVQFFACYVNADEYGGLRTGESAQKILTVKAKDEKRWDAAYEAVLEMIEYARRECDREFLLTDAGDVQSDAGESGVRAERAGGILTVEEGGVLNGKLSRLDELYERGIRLVTLTWNYENCIGYPNSRDRSVMEKGLTDFGIQTVRKMNDLGMIVDVSHLSDGGFWDCIRYSKYPVAASHSNARSLCRHPRNLSDEMLHTLGENGGVAGLNFYARFLKEKTEAAGGGQRGTAVATPADIAEHTAWMLQKAGEDAVALGTDFDGFDPDFLPVGIQGVENMELVWEAMRKKGITPRQIDKIAYGNIMQIIQDVWK